MTDQDREAFGTRLVKTRKGRADVFDGHNHICSSTYHLSWYTDSPPSDEPVGDLRVYGTIVPEVICPIGQDLTLHLSATERVKFFFRDGHGAVTITGAVVTYPVQDCEN